MPGHRSSNPSRNESRARPSSTRHPPGPAKWVVKTMPLADPLAVVSQGREHDLRSVAVPANCCLAERKITMSE